jgi:hypothetical protein
VRVIIYDDVFGILRNYHRVGGSYGCPYNDFDEDKFHNINYNSLARHGHDAPAQLRATPSNPPFCCSSKLELLKLCLRNNARGWNLKYFKMMMTNCLIIRSAWCAQAMEAVESVGFEVKLPPCPRI